MHILGIYIMQNPHIAMSVISPGTGLATHLTDATWLTVLLGGEGRG